LHWVIETPQPTQVGGMKWLLGTCASRFNLQRRQFGHLFSGPCKALCGAFGDGQPWMPELPAVSARQKIIKYDNIDSAEKPPTTFLRVIWL
jgi:hypothetical protein